MQDVPPESETELNIATSSARFTKRYEIDKSVNANLQEELPEIPLPKAVEELPGATQKQTALPTDNELSDITNLYNITLPDDLPALEHNVNIDDFEALMSFENDFDNTNLMPVGRAPMLDVTKEINSELGINQDLEIAMENARFLEENTQVNSATVSSRKNTREQNEDVGNNTAPLSPRGRFKTKTHGIKKLSPEERKDKKF